MLKAIIFDMDGVIIDSEYLDYQLQSRLLLEIASPSIHLVEKDFQSLVGLSGQHLLESIKKLTRTTLTLPEIQEKLDEIAGIKYAPRQIRKLFRPKLRSLLDWAKQKGLLLAVASSSNRAHIEEVLEACQIRDYFSVLVTGQDFETSKPHPAIYQAALAQLKLRPDQAIAIEDSPVGITSAKEAGLTVIGYEEPRLHLDQSQADVLLADWSAILSYLKSHS